MATWAAMGRSASRPPALTAWPPRACASRSSTQDQRFAPRPGAFSCRAFTQAIAASAETRAGRIPWRNPSVLRTSPSRRFSSPRDTPPDSPDAEPGLPRRQGFDEFYGYLSQVHAHNYYPTFLWRNEEKVRLRNTVPNETPAGAGKSDNKLDYSHDLIADEALDFIRRHRDRPFFLFFTPTIPHANNEARAEGMEVPDLGPYANLDWPPGVRGHAAMISRLDRDVGRVLDLLRELGIAERTLVFFSSDNGPHKEGGFDPEFNDSNGPLRGIKRDLYEGGIRVPMIVWGPGRVPAGQVSDEPWWFADFLPTAAALAGVKPPDRLDGIDASPLLRGKSLRSRPPLYWEFHERGFKQAVLRHPWKAVRLAPGEPVELYHLGRDPGETRNLAEEFPARARRLARLMDRMRVDSPDWPIRAGSSP
jgi:arylsulfatase A-like enzyme